MAFIFEKERGLSSYDAHILETTHLGPGRYQQPETKKQEKSYAPFLSTTGRAEEPSKSSSNGTASISGQINSQKSTSPGPGSYEVSKPLVKSTVTGTMINDQTIMFKVQQQASCNFKSNINRFGSSESSVPGPGYYTGQDNSIKHKSHRVNKETQPVSEQSLILNEIRLHNMTRKTVSIPNRTVERNNSSKSNNNSKNNISLNHQQGKQLSKEGRVIDGIFQGNDITKNQQQSQAASQTQQANTRSGSSQHGDLWVRSKVSRFDDNTNSSNLSYKNQSLGPGRYNISRVFVPAYKKGMSASFIQSNRQPLFSQSTLPVQPEPGTYNLPSSFAQTSKKRAYSSFQSVEDRFKDEDKGYNLDPGQYQQQKNSPQLNRKATTGEMPFACAKERDDSFLCPYKTQKDNPPVGEYEVNQSKSIRSDVVKKYHSGYKGKFGTHQPRFKAEKEEYPGPGEYVIKESDIENDKVAKIKQKQPPGGFNYDSNCVFKSQTQREPYGKIEKDIPGFGEYNLDYNSIAYKITKQQLFIENLKKIEVEKPGFDSREPRFNYGKVTEDKDNLNLSAIEKENLNQQSRIKSTSASSDTYTNASMQRASPAFASKVKKMEYDRSDYDVPGPGIYEGARAEWNKRSYNVKYQKK